MKLCKMSLSCLDTFVMDSDTFFALMLKNFCSVGHFFLLYITNIHQDVTQTGQRLIVLELGNNCGEIKEWLIIMRSD